MECVTGVWGALHARGQSNRTPVAYLKSSRNYDIRMSLSGARALRTKRPRTHLSVYGQADTCDPSRIGYPAPGADLIINCCILESPICHACPGMSIHWIERGLCE